MIESDRYDLALSRALVLRTNTTLERIFPGIAMLTLSTYATVAGAHLCSEIFS